MFAKMKKPLALGALAIALCALFTLPTTTGLEAQGSGKFKSRWRKINKKQEDALNRKNLAEELSADNLEMVDDLMLVLEDKHWNVRLPGIVAIAKTSSEEVIESWMEKLFDRKTEDGVRDQIAFGLSRRSLQKEHWPQLYKIVADKEGQLTFSAREIVALRLASYPGPRPPVVTINDNKEKTAEIEKKIAEIEAQTQPIMKETLRALFEVLKSLEEASGKEKKNPDYRKLRWTVIHAMETLTSEEHGESIKKWQTWMENVHFDKETKGLKHLKYKWPKTVTETVGGVKLQGNKTAVRKNKRRNTNTELILLPQMGSPVQYFEPYMSEFTHYFDVSSFRMPGAEEGEPTAKDARGNDLQGYYYYPTAKVANMFEKRRKDAGGNKNLGILCHGESVSIALEFAKRNPKSCAFIICVGGWANNTDVSAGIGQCKSNMDRLDLKYYGMINRTSYFGNPPRYPEEFTDWKKFLANCGNFRHQFSDPYDINQVVVRQKQINNPSPRRNRRALIDPKYAFKGKNIKVPTLFIWGADDPMFVKASEKTLSKMFKNSMTVKMKGVSRMPWLEDPIGFHDIIEQFMVKKKVWERIDEANAKKGKSKK